MDLPGMANANYLHLKENLTQLQEQQNVKDKILSDLLEERNRLLHEMSQEVLHCQSDGSLLHYAYILPLVKEVHQLELRLKQKEEEYEKRLVHYEAARLAQLVLVDSFSEDECVLKRWARELKELSSETTGKAEEMVSSSYSITNISYSAALSKHVLCEALGFTVLCQGVHVRVLIKSETACPVTQDMMAADSKQLPSFEEIIRCELYYLMLSSGPLVNNKLSSEFLILPLSLTSAKIGVSSDTYIPELDERVRAAVSQKSHISGLILLVQKYIQEDIAPYVIIIPVKKKTKKIKSDKMKS